MVERTLSSEFLIWLQRSPRHSNCKPLQWDWLKVQPDLLVLQKRELRPHELPSTRPPTPTRARLEPSRSSRLTYTYPGPRILSQVCLLFLHSIYLLFVTCLSTGRKLCVSYSNFQLLFRCLMVPVHNSLLDKCFLTTIHELHQCKPF